MASTPEANAQRWRSWHSITPPMGPFSARSAARSTSEGGPSSRTLVARGSSLDGQGGFEGAIRADKSASTERDPVQQMSSGTVTPRQLSRSESKGWRDRHLRRSGPAGVAQFAR